MIHARAIANSRSGDENSTQPRRRVTHITVVLLQDGVNVFETAEDATRFLDDPILAGESKDMERYEVRIEFSNGDKIAATYNSKTRVKEFIDFFAK